MSESLSTQAQLAIGVVAEAFCPLCRVRLIVHDGRACCRFCADSYMVSVNPVEVGRCQEHGKHCEHWRLSGPTGWMLSRADPSGNTSLDLITGQERASRSDGIEGRSRDATAFSSS